MGVEEQEGSTVQARNCTSGIKDHTEVQARKELVRSCIFSRRITREESVKELAEILAASTSNLIDEELGGYSQEHTGKYFIKTDATAHLFETSPRENPTDETVKSEDLPPPSAPPSPGVVTDTIANAIANYPEDTSNLSQNPTGHVITIRNMQNNFNSNQMSSSAPPQSHKRE